MDKHSELPWRVGDDTLSISEQDGEIRQGDRVLFSGNSNFYDQAAIDAKFVVECVNNHYRLVSENERLREALEDFLRVCEPGAFICHDADVIDNARKVLERKQP